MRRPRGLGSIDIETGTLAEVIGVVIGDPTAPRRGVGEDQIAFSWVQVRPERYQRTGTRLPSGPSSAWGGR
jgi:hypothetical protein